ncbi:MAG: FtsX-like permease family protein [Lachnospiraceae bacterium]|nr:FtsX-like permease family protein [Lachnospiraceae bacterium]
MRKAAGKDILRTIWKEKKRFISIMLITALGVTMMTGLSAGCKDLRYSADQFFDEQELFDVSILSTLGLTQEDVDILTALEGVKKAEGSYSEIVHTQKGDINKTAEVKTVQADGMNLPYVLEGSLPVLENEIAVTRNYIADTGKAIGDKVIIEEILKEEDKISSAKEDELENEVETPNFLYTEYTITGVVVDVMDINNADSAAAFRATPNADYTFFVLPKAVDSEIFTAVYLSLEGAGELLCYSAEYEEKVIRLVSRIEGEIKEQREQARYEAITGEAYGKINDAQKEMDEAFAEAEEKFADAQKEITDGWQEMAEGKQELFDKEQEAAAEIADARAEIAEGYEQLEEGQKELQEAANQLYEGNLAMAKGRAELEDKEAQAKEQIAQGEATLAARKKENEDARAAMVAQVAQASAGFGAAWPADAWNTYVSILTQVMLPMMQSQVSSDQSSMTKEQQQAFVNMLQGDQRVVQAGQDFGRELTDSITTMQGVLMQQKAEQENQLLGVNSSLLAQEQSVISLENEISDLEGQVAGWEQDKINLEKQGAAVPDYDIRMEELNRQIEEAKVQIGEKHAQKEQALAVQIQLNDEKVKLEAGINQISEQLQQVNALLADLDQALIQLSRLAMGVAWQEATGQILNQATAVLAEKKASAQAQIDAAWAEIEAGEARLAEATRQIHEGKAKLEENRQKLGDAVRELEENEQKAKEEFAKARAEIADGEQELLEGQQKLGEEWSEYEEEKVRAGEKIAEAKAEVEDLDMTQWYVQDRTSLSGYVNVKSDTLSIEALASVFTVVFFVVAILISLTTVTRMVEEERGLIGTYKALGFTDHEIREKYVVYALAASLTGGVLGDVWGFIVLPKILFMFFDVMYLFPTYLLQFNFSTGMIGILLFMVGIVGAAIWACETELKHLPAQLMRPKAPKAGSRVLLERIAFIWKRLSFLNKVTARNLFRYKKRLLMTILGIAGCTALVLFGFAIKDSVAELMPLQYERVYKYDLLAAASDNDKLLKYMNKSDEVEEYLNIQVENVKLKNAEGDTEKVQIMIFPKEADITSYITLTNVDKEAADLAQEGICLTENAVKTLNLKKGDGVFIQKLDLVQKEVQITEVVKNYLGNNIYMSQEAYESAFGKYEPNGILANLADSCQDKVGFSDTLAMEDWILSSVSTQELKGGFSTAFTLINIVVYVVLILAAGLAFVVLFTLATTNISERIRELATIKVLGFFDREVHLYVNKETLILTGMGILLGLPLGTVMSSSLTNILDMPSIYFAVTIYPQSFWISAGIALTFALMVQFLTDRSLDRIDMVEALKSIE